VGGLAHPRPAAVGGWGEQDKETVMMMNKDLFSNLNVPGELGADPQMLDSALNQTFQIVLTILGYNSLECPEASEESLAELGPNAGLGELLQTRRNAN
jgi:hypothetical protein